MDKILLALGLAVCMYALAEVVGAAIRKLEAENKMPLFRTILALIGAVLFFCSAPIALINMVHDSRVKALSDKENAERYSSLRKIDHRLINELQSEVARLEEEKWDIRFEESNRGRKAGYKSGYIDGYVASCVQALSEEDRHLQHDWQWNHNAKSAAHESLQFKENMDRIWEENLS